MREKIIEHALIRAVLKRGGLCPKFVSPGYDGMPDRIILMPGGRIAFAELKAPGKKPRPLQLYMHTQLRLLGFQVFVIDNPSQIQEVIHVLSSS